MYSWVVSKSMLKHIKKQKEFIPVENYKDTKNIIAGEAGRLGSIRIVVSQYKGD